MLPFFPLSPNPDNQSTIQIFDNDNFKFSDFPPAKFYLAHFRGHNNMNFRQLFHFCIYIFQNNMVLNF